MSSRNTGCLGFLFSLFGAHGAEPSWHGGSASVQLPYRVRQDLLSPAEASFYHILRQATGERYTVFAKVGLGDLFYVSQQADRRTWYNRIDRKHVDFLLCDALTLQPVAGIELDDASHNRPDRQARDAFVDQVFEAAGLPLIHVPVRRHYTLEDLRESLKIVMGMGASRVAAASAPVAARRGGPPHCPRCGVPLVVRRAQKGQQAGGQFWGCPNYPRCRHAAPIE